MNREIVFDTSNRHCDKGMISYIKSLLCSFNYSNTGQIFFYSMIDRLRSIYLPFTWSDSCIKQKGQKVKRERILREDTGAGGENSKGRGKGMKELS